MPVHRPGLEHNTKFPQNSGDSRRKEQARKHISRGEKKNGEKDGARIKDERHSGGEPGESINDSTDSSREYLCEGRCSSRAPTNQIQEPQRPSTVHKMAI